MMHSLCYHVFFAVLLAVSAVASAADVVEGRELKLSQAIDFLDNCFFTEHPEYYTRDELAARLRQARDAGITRIYFRAVSGCAYYPSEVLKVYNGDARQPNAEKLRRTIREYDVLAEYIRVCHELGMELYYWEPIFDTSLYLRYESGTPEFRKYGEWPFKDEKLRDDEQWRHRFADRDFGRLTRPVATIRIVSKNDPGEVNERNLVIFTAGEGENFTRCDDPYRVTVEPGPGAGEREIVVSGLNITRPCIKLMNDSRNGAFMAIADLASDCVRMFYDDGSPVEIPVASEVFIMRDENCETNLRGGSGILAGWGDAGNLGRTMILRIGLFDRYADGLPEYAFRGNRDRRLAVLRELFDRYPELDGVCYSIRSHSLPSGGSRSFVGDYAYGFSAPVVDEYRRRYGVDITRQAYDREKFLTLRGEFFTDFLREAGEFIHSRGGKFAVMAPVRESVGAYDHGAMYPLWKGMNIDNFFQIDRWAQEGFVDAVVMLGTGHRQKGWSPAWDAEVSAFRAKLAGTDTRLVLHLLANSALKPELEATLRGALGNTDLDEIEFYEEHGMFVYGHYEVLERVLAESERRIAAPVAKEESEPGRDGKTSRER